MFTFGCKNYANVNSISTIFFLLYLLCHALTTKTNKELE